MKTDFYNRKEELQSLSERHLSKKHAELIVVYGRRRVGKTELVRHFLESAKIPMLYFYVDLLEKPKLIESVSTEILSQIGEGTTFRDWKGFFEYIESKSSKDFVLVIDEFQRFLDVSPDFITTLQRCWDEKLQHTRITIFLVGSSIGMMQKIVESKTGPLYGRTTGRMKISPFRYQDFREVFPELTEEKKIMLYSVFGGTPQYFLLAKDYGEDLFKAIEELILTKGRELEEEPERFLEYEQVRTRAKYNSILQSVAQGKSTLKEIAEHSKIAPTTIPAYLQRMDTLLDLIAKRDPVLGKERLGKYILKDPFFTFWYRFIFPHKGALHYGNTAQVLDLIKENLNAHTGVIFENIAKELLITYNGKTINGIPIHFDDIGSWWDRNGHEIDIVANDSKDRTLLIGEVKWTAEKMDVGKIDDLLEKIHHLKCNGTFRIILISKSGFTTHCLERIKQTGGIALDLKDLQTLLDHKENQR